MIHFFEAIERENDYQKEYFKLEKLCADSIFYSSINRFIEDNFLKWKRRSNYTSYAELRDKIGFSVEKDGCGCYREVSHVSLREYILYCEMILNLFRDLRDLSTGMDNYVKDELDDRFALLTDTIKATIDKAGMEIRIIDDVVVIVENNPVAIEVVDKNPQLKDPIIEYNSYLLKGNIERKRELLRKIADDLEVKRPKLKALNERQTSDYFDLINNFNIRHNNIDPETKNYNETFVSMSLQEKEDVYDLIYEQGLALYVLLDQQIRNDRIKEYKEQVQLKNH